MNVLPYGDRALLLELTDAAAVVARVDALRADPALEALADDLVPGARTVLVRARPGASLEDLRSTVESGEQPVGERRGALATSFESAPGIDIPVAYDGPDLAEVSRLTGLPEDEVVAAHTGTPWRVAFGGFAPGFAYLVGGDPRLTVPRRDTPRPRVPSGSVGLAGEFTGVYPRESPGGWQLIGRTEVTMWDLDRDPPALLGAGATVRFVNT